MNQVNFDEKIIGIFPSLKNICIYNTNADPHIYHKDVMDIIEKTKIRLDEFTDSDYKTIDIYTSGVKRKVKVFTYSGIVKISKKHSNDKLTELLELLDILRNYPSVESNCKIEIKLLKTQLFDQSNKIITLESQVEKWKKKAEDKEREFICLIEDYKIAMNGNAFKDEVYALRDEVYTLKEKIKELTTTDTKDINSYTFLKAIRQVECAKVWIEVVGCEDIREIDTDILCTMSIWDKKPIHCEVYNLPSFIPKNKSLKELHEFLCKIGVGIPTGPKTFQNNKYNCTIDVLRGLIDQFLFESYVKLADPKNNIGEYEPLEFDYKINSKKAITNIQPSVQIPPIQNGMPFESDPDDLSIRNIYYKEANF
jgi:hypothetical protein